jgi:hypothetical protein
MKIKTLPLVLYVCENVSLRLMKKGKLGVFQKRVMNRNFEPKSDIVGGG